MAFFKFRLPGQSAGESQGSTSNTPAESVDALRRRARHRLIGASVLVVLGVIGFPVLFDTQPRPVSVDIAVDIPDRASSKPLVDTSKQKPLLAGAGLDAKEEVMPDVKADIKPEAVVAGAAGAAAVAAAVPKPEAKPELVKAEAKSPAKLEAKAEAKSDTKPESKAAAKASDSKDTGRFVVQAGTFADDGKLGETRRKLEKAGIHTYTQAIDGKDGRQVRVRVGPFASREEAEKMVRKIKQLQLDSKVITL